MGAYFTRPVQDDLLLNAIPVSEPAPGRPLTYYQIEKQRFNLDEFKRRQLQRDIKSLNRELTKFERSCGLPTIEEYANISSTDETNSSISNEDEIIGRAMIKPQFIYNALPMNYISRRPMRF